MSSSGNFKLKSTSKGNAICAVHDGSMEVFMVVDDHDEAKRYVTLLNESNVNRVII